jgi:Fe-S-cluster-containing hydrogenase component 2
MAVRQIVEIDEEKCDGCGQCIPACAEGALKVVDGKARLVSDLYCDGLGNCLGVCPQDAIRVVEREADAFDEDAAAAHLRRHTPNHAHGMGAHGAACPGAALMDLTAGRKGNRTDAAQGQTGERPSALMQWPVQLHLAPVRAPFFDGADLLLAADCVPFALAGFHERLLAGRTLLVGCPKLDDAELYAKKLAAIFGQNDIRSLTVVHMEVPCCHGLTALAQTALAQSGKQVPLTEVTVTVRGEIRDAHGVEAQR